MNQHSPIYQITGSGEEDNLLLSDIITRSGQQPFCGSDTSAGMEYELQVAVAGNHRDVDLPIAIRSSTFFKNLIKRTARGDMPTSCVESLKEFLFHNDSEIWENSWVRFQENRLTPWAARMMAGDFLSDKSNPHSRKRGDIHRFRTIHRGRECLRLPVSYVLKLALANVISADPSLSPVLFATGKNLLSHFLSDNTSPEILSFTIQRAGDAQIGDKAAAESARTYLFCQLLVQYANTTFGLEDSGQRCLLYSAPHAPIRQKQLNEIVPHGYYRHPFMSPCLSGWDRGEEKHRYMELCHRTLSRSQLNAIGKLREAGIISNNLIVLPNTSTTCLANNGTHVSLGSSILTDLAQNHAPEYNPETEKNFGDLAIKVIEHFLPLFVNTYSAAPYRIDFPDFHPEKVLGFLPHELDYTHLRMLWRRWQKKAAIRVFGRTVTPFGPRWLDRSLASVLRLKGDTVPDYRLIDYLVTLLSTDTSPALNGRPGNHERLKDELAEMGVFDSRMSIYLPYRQRIFAASGYCGFEGRSYSLFHSLLGDMAEAVDMQNIVTALACRYILTGRVSHLDIPDKPSVESERRQIFFGCAVGIPTFYVRADTGNRFLKKILSNVRNQRHSRRYKGYIRVSCESYRLALLNIIERDAADLLEQSGLKNRIHTLRARLTGESPATFHKIVAGIKNQLSSRKTPLEIPAREFNSAMEAYFRTSLKQDHMKEGLEVLRADCHRLELAADPHLRQAISATGYDGTAHSYIALCQNDIINETAAPETLTNLLRLGLAVLHHERNSQGTP